MKYLNSVLTEVSHFVCMFLFVSVFHLSRRTNFVYCWFSLSGRQSLYNINSCPKQPRYTWCCHCCPSPSLTSSNAVSNTHQSIIISKERPISTFSNIWPVVYRFTDDKIFSVTNPFLELSVNSAKTNSARATRPGHFFTFFLAKSTKILINFLVNFP